MSEKSWDTRADLYSQGNMLNSVFGVGFHAVPTKMHLIQEDWRFPNSPQVPLLKAPHAWKMMHLFERASDILDSAIFSFFLTPGYVGLIPGYLPTPHGEQQSTVSRKVKLTLGEGSLLYW